jgi:hypothetical protein
MNNRSQARSPRRNRLVRAALAGVAVLALGGAAVGPQSAASAQSSATAGRSREENVKKLTGKRLRIDARTGRPRAITAQEARETVDQLRAVLGAQEARGPIRGADGVVALELRGIADRTVVARPRENGTFATRCVVSVDEAVDFLSGDLSADREER